jgi:hypothetical protein
MDTNFILTFPHPQICTSAHPHIFTFSHLHICTSAHPHICTFSHLHIFTFSHSHMFLHTAKLPADRIKNEFILFILFEKIDYRVAA